MFLPLSRRSRGPAAPEGVVPDELKNVRFRQQIAGAYNVVWSDVVRKLKELEQFRQILPHGVGF